VKVVSVWTSFVRRDAQVAQEALAGARGAEHDRALEHRAHEHEHQEDERDDVDHRGVVLLYPLVDGDLREERAGELHRRRADHRDAGPRDQPPVRPQDRADLLSHAASSWRARASSAR
jgi:hypothetical protein